jgi:hypothetical protein
VFLSFPCYDPNQKGGADGWTGYVDGYVDLRQPTQTARDVVRVVVFLALGGNWMGWMDE